MQRDASDQSQAKRGELSPISNAVVIVSWPLPADGWVLVTGTKLLSAPQTTVWTPVTLPYQTNATTIRMTEPAPVGRKFYRLRNEPRSVKKQFPISSAGVIGWDALDKQIAGGP